MTDPLDLDEFRRNGHALIDWIAEYLGSLEERPVIEPVSPGDVRSKLPAEPPLTAEPFAAMLADLDDVVVPGLTHWQHPHWFSFFPAMSSPPAILGELAAAGLGVQGMLWSTSPAATEIESHVLDWLVDLMGVPERWKTTGPGGGVLQMSASDSTHTALVVAREVCRQRTGAPAESMVAYTSSQAHSSIEKGGNVAGYGHVRLLEVDEYRAYFLNRFDELLRTTLSPEHVIDLIDRFAAEIEDDIERDLEIWSDEWEALVASSKFASMPGYGRETEGHIALQDHGDVVEYRKLRIRPL